MKKVSKVLLAMTLMLTMFIVMSINAMASNVATLTAVDVTGAPGEEVTVLLDLQFLPGEAANTLNIRLAFDGAVLTRVTANGPAAIAAAPGSPFTLPALAGVAVTDFPVNFEMGNPTDNADTSGPIAGFVFRIDDNAVPGTTTPITLTFVSSYYLDQTTFMGSTQTVTVVSGVITIEEAGLTDDEWAFLAAIQFIAGTATPTPAEVTAAVATLNALRALYDFWYEHISDYYTFTVFVNDILPYW